MCSRSLKLPDLFGRSPLVLRPECGEVEGIRVTPEFRRDRLDALHALRKYVDASHHRDPSIGPLCYASEGAWVMDAADEDRRMRFALGLREAAHRRKVDVAAEILRNILRPEHFHRSDIVFDLAPSM